MKYLMTLFLSLTLMACSSNASVKPLNSPIADTVKVVDTSLQKKYDSLVLVLKDTKKDLFVANYKLGQVKYRIKICKNNVKLKKFFFGWVDRLVSEE